MYGRRVVGGGDYVGGGVGREWQIESEGGALAFFAVDFDPAVVVAHDAVDHGQPHADALALFFGGEEGVEDFFWISLEMPQPVSVMAMMMCGPTVAWGWVLR